jgi:Uma2 family endonuclease
MTAQPKHKWTVEEYLAFDRESDHRNEFIDGEVYSMVGASEKHLLISMNISISLGTQMMQRGCRLYANDLRVRRRGTTDYFYPDFTGICGERDFDDQNPATLLNPQLIIEILSSSTEKKDRSQKLLAYRAIPSIQECLLISQKIPHVELFVRRNEPTWDWIIIEGLDSIVDLTSVGCTLPLSAVYQGITFDQSEDDA